MLDSIISEMSIQQNYNENIELILLITIVNTTGKLGLAKKTYDLGQLW